ncbi:MAG: nicotinate-nucleotide--dimethylbenzimidazole phosphoribosyltransferase [Clostridiales bacterium]|nr:nicotinate-nucleotide--dimethylbenzimidazole phosphoribosyltransferase [Clostridiales bacterium]
MGSVRESRLHWDGIAKPLGSLGILEDMIAQIAGMRGDADVRLDRRRALVLCADNGVVAEGVTQVGSEVTALVAASIASGTGNINAMARAANAEVLAVDIGMVAPVDHPGVLDCRIGPGTANMARGPAMTRQEAERAIRAGVDLARRAVDDGCDILITGEMGIGNTTSSSAVACALSGLPVAQVTGRGAGLSDEGLKRKTDAIGRALAINSPDPGDPIDVLSKVGGFDIAGMAGVFLGGALYRLPVVVDGFISAIAALIAARLCPGARDYMLASHISREPACQWALSQLSLRPVIHAGMALGEGTGGVALLPLLDMALAVYRQNSTFEHIHMAAYTRFDGEAT